MLPPAQDRARPNAWAAITESLAEVEHFNDHVPQSAWSDQASDGYRAIVIMPEKGDTYILVHIDSHDRAYQWARRKRFEVHQMIGND